MCVYVCVRACVRACMAAARHLSLPRPPAQPAHTCCAHPPHPTPAGLRALIYSGDHDMAVPHTGTEAWTAAFAESQGMRELHGWTPWHTGDHQVAGYAVHYQGGRQGGGAQLVYATVKGAGHMVPSSKPAEALAMFDRFLFDGSLHPCGSGSGVGPA